MKFTTTLSVTISTLLPFVGTRAQTPATRPNIVWILLEDWTTDLSCYGTKGISTPACDQLAEEGIRYTHAFCTAPVCSTSRSAMMTGFHQNFIGANQHRTADKRPLPEGIQPLPNLLQQAGYHTSLYLASKTDVNFETKLGFDSQKGWDDRKEGQPFFCQITLAGTHRPWKRDPENPIDPADVELPPYYADTAFVRRDWANGLESMQVCDREVAGILKKLARDGVAGNTLVFLIGDNGRCHFRGKQFMYDPGLRVPLIIRWPGVIQPGQVKDDLVQTIDITATTLEAAGVTPQQPLHGQDLLGPIPTDREYVFAARDKMDDTHDAMRMVRSHRYKLIQNLMPERPYLQFNGYKESMYPVLAEMSVLHLQGELNPVQDAFFVSTKPEFELYDLESDPHEVRNLAEDPAHAETKAVLLAELSRWRTSINDQGVTEEFRKGGRPATYPTKTLAEWQAVLAKWEPWVMRPPDAKMTHPSKIK